MDKNKSLFARLKHSFSSMFKRLFSNKHKEGLSALEEEAITSPTKVIWKNFINDKLARVGLIGFAFMMLFSYVGSLIVPLNSLDIETILKDVKPGHGYLSYDKLLETEGVEAISSGITYSLGLTKQGKVVGWGLDQEGVLELPNDVKNSKISKVSAGDRHALALTSTGNVIAWGYNTFKQGEVDPVMKQLFKAEGVRDILAGEAYSAVLTEKNNLYVWGSVNNSKLDIIPEAYQGRITAISGTSYNIVILLDDGTIAPLGVKNNEFSNIPTQLTDGSINVTQVAASYRNGVAIDDQGKIHAWGSTENDMMNLPEINEKIISVDGGRNNMVALGESGRVYSWGSNYLKQQNVPTNVKASEVYTDFFQAYAVGTDGKISAWGNDGYWLGTDSQGRDFLSRLIHGGKITLMVGFIASIVSACIGVMVGMIAGFKGGWVDNLLMRITEVFSSIPFMPLVITLSALLGRDMSSEQKMYLIMVILGLISWPGLARLIRAQILIEREKDFVLAARSLGIKEFSIIVRHILPNVLNICIVNITLSYAGNMLTESGLSFLGFGVQQPMPSWGNMLTGAQEPQVIRNYWWEWILPALCIMIAAFSINLIGDGLRSALDPKANEK